jgi:hypothetical protein
MSSLARLALSDPRHRLKVRMAPQWCGVGGHGVRHPCSFSCEGILMEGYHVMQTVLAA